MDFMMNLLCGGFVLGLMNPACMKSVASRLGSMPPHAAYPVFVVAILLALSLNCNAVSVQLQHRAMWWSLALPLSSR